MSAHERKYFSADTLERALLQAASQFGLDPDRVAYRTVEKKHGFIKSQKKFVIEVDAAEPQLKPGVVPSHLVRAATEVGRAPSVPSPRIAPSAARPDRSERKGRGRDEEGRGRHGGGREGRGGRGRRDVPPQAGPGRPERGGEELLVPLPDIPRRLADIFSPAQGPAAAAALEEANRLLRIAGLRLEATVLQGEDRLEIDLEGEDREVCFRDSGELLFALEHLVPRLVRARTGESVLCRVDCDSFHAIREEQLRSLAQRLAGEVARSGDARILEPMNPADRRVVHITLEDDKAVVTESEGNGYFKRVVIRPA